MTNQQFDSFLEALARLIEKAESTEEAAEIIRSHKTKKNKVNE